MLRSRTLDLPLTVVTVWSPEWSAGSGRFGEWLVKEDFPIGTRFVWVIEEASASDRILADLANALTDEARAGRDYRVDSIVYEKQLIKDFE